VTKYYDTSDNGTPLTATGQVYAFGDECEFYISVASNQISAQATGPTTKFTIYSRKNGPEDFNVDYATTNTTYAVKRSGYLVNATVPTGGNPVSCRVVISSEPTPLTVVTVAAVGSVTLAGTVNTDLGQANGAANLVTPLVPNTHLGSADQPDITANQSAALGSSGKPVYIRTLGSSDKPVPQAGDGSNAFQHALAQPSDGSVGIAAYNGSAYAGLRSSSAGEMTIAGKIAGGGAYTSLNTDSTGNLQHVPVVQASSTPIYGKAITQDSSGNQIHKLAGNATLIETRNALSAEATGSGNLLGSGRGLTTGDLVTYTMSATAFGATSNTTATYMYFVGATSGYIYATLLGPGNVAGSFVMVASEALQVFYSNGSSDDNIFAVAYQVTTP
jgi:hypothetical protein